MNVDDARKFRDDFFVKNNEQVNYSLNLIYEKIQNSASNGWSSTSFDFSEVGCPTNLGTAVLNKLVEEGFTVEKSLGKVIVRW